MSEGGSPTEAAVLPAGGTSDARPVHYGAGMRGSICGDHGPRLETSNKLHVTCKQCISIIGKSKR